MVTLLYIRSDLDCLNFFIAKNSIKSNALDFIDDIVIFLIKLGTYRPCELKWKSNRICS